MGAGGDYLWRAIVIGAHGQREGLQGDDEMDRWKGRETRVGSAASVNVEEDHVEMEEKGSQYIPCPNCQRNRSR